MAAKFTRLTHEIAIQLHLVAESCTIFSSRSRRPVQELLDTPSCIYVHVCVCVCVHHQLHTMQPVMNVITQFKKTDRAAGLRADGDSSQNVPDRRLLRYSFP
jgi:hypothetical protein